MTSKSLFFKLMREDGKQRLWSFVLAIIVFFFFLPVAGAAQVSDPVSEKMLSDTVTNYMIDISPFFAVITFIGSMICGINGFSYLQSKKKVDFYHGIPVRREMLYAVSYLNGILIYLVSFLVNLCLYLLIVSGKSLTPGLMIRYAFSAFALHLVNYLLLYTVAVIAVMLTGNMLSATMGCLILHFYGILIQLLNWGFHSYFYDTFWTRGLRPYFWVSPATAYMAATSSLEYNMKHWGFPWGDLATVLSIWLALTVAALFLYRGRPSEAAERAVAFPKTKPVIYLLLSVPVTLSGGWMFASMASQYSDGWMIFGMVCGWLLAHGVLQIVMESEFKAAFRGGVKMAVAGAAAAVITAVFAFDLTGFDTYIPSESQFYSAAVGMSNLNENVFIEEVNGRSLYRVDVPVSEMSFTDYGLLVELLEETEEFRSKDGRMAVNVAADGEENGANYATNLYVKYCLKNGKVVYRNYWLTTDKRELVNRVFTDKSFKEGCYPILTRSEEEIGNAYFYNGINSSVRLDVSHAELMRLFRAFCEEYRELTLYDMEEIPFGTLTFAKDKNEGEPDYYVYPSMTETIGLLADAGMKSRQQAVRADTRITISTPDLYYFLQGEGLVEGTDVPEVTYTGEKAGQLLEAAAPSDWMWENTMVLRRENKIEFAISVSGGPDENGNETYESYSFAMGRVPDFVREDLNLDELERLQEQANERMAEDWEVE